MGAPTSQNEVFDLTRTWPGYVYYVSAEGTDKAQIRIVPKDRRINRIVVDARRNEAIDIYGRKPGWRELRTDEDLAQALAHVTEMQARARDRILRERAQKVEAQAMVTAQAAAAAVKATLSASEPEAPRRSR